MSMSTTGRPVARLSGEQAYAYFNQSGKRHLFLTGDRGSGKSTLLSKILPLLSEASIPGITTWAVPKHGVFLKDNLSGETVQIGEYVPGIDWQSHRMQTIPDTFEQLGCRLLEQHLHGFSEWVSIDEIGYLEASCQRYCQDLLSLLDCKRVVAVLRKKDLPFLNDLKAREDACVIDLDTPENYFEQ